MDSSEDEQSDIELDDDSSFDVTELESSSYSESDLNSSSESNAENFDSETVENTAEEIFTEYVPSHIEDETIWADYEGRHRSFEFTGIYRLFAVLFYFFLFVLSLVHFSYNSKYCVTLFFSQFVRQNRVAN